jgi:photosystem II stability/assembly factor-like uncharacterized protein
MMAMALLLTMGPWPWLQNVIAQSWAPTPSSWVRESTLRSVHFINPKTGWACGDRGTLLRTQDGGESWEVISSPVQCRLDSIFFIDARQGWACGGYVSPVSHRSEGVLLATSDGGATWKRVSVPSLTWLRKIEFDSPSTGWAVGAKTAHQPSGVYYTRDGGRSWIAAADFGDSSWEDGAKFTGTERVVVGTGGGVQRLRTDQFEPGYLLDGRLPQLHAIKTIDESRGWAVGERGSIYHTTNQGLSWQQRADPAQIPGLGSLHFKALDARGDHAWMTGQPASVLVHTHDGGTSWQWTQTGIDVDIESICFADELHGWAVGGLGKIYATLDGGLTWSPQRNAGLQIFAMHTGADDSALPLEALARIAANEGWLTSGIYPFKQPSNFAPKSFPKLEQEQWLTLTGMVEMSWWNPRHAGLEPTRTTAKAGETEANQADQWDDWKEYLTLKIRQQRPAVLLLPAPSHSRLNRGQQNFYDMCLEASRDAGRVDKYPLQISHMGLQPWKPAKIFAVSDRKVSNGILIPTDQFALQLGRTLDDLCYPSRVSLSRGSATPPRQYQLMLVETDLPVATAGKSLQGDLSPLWRDAAQRPTLTATSGTFQNVQQLTSLPHALSQLGQLTVDSDPTGAIWIANVRRQLERLDDWSGGNFLYRLAQLHLDQKQNRIAARAYRLMAEDYPDHPLADASLLWLWEHYSSHEWQWQDDSRSSHPTIQSQTSRNHPSATASFQDLVQQAKNREVIEQAEIVPINNLNSLEFEPVKLEEGQTVKPVFLFQPDALQNVEGEPAQLRLADLQTQEKEEYLNRLEQFLMTQRPALLSDWRVRLQRISLRNKHKTSPADWLAIRDLFPNVLSKIAEQELWLQQPLTHETPEFLVEIPRIETPPRLDGQLDEAYWQAAWDHQQRLMLRLGADSKVAPSHVMLACDEEFLYIAAVCQKIHDAPYPTDPSPPQRDGAAKDIDHLDLFLDLDRDHQTAFHLCVDSLGRASDLVGNSPSWDPQWFVSRSDSATTWTVEIAIPFEQLGWTPQENIQWWGLGIQRSCNGFGTAYWGLQESSLQQEGSPLIEGLLGIPASLPAPKHEPSLQESTDTALTPAVNDEPMDLRRIRPLNRPLGRNIEPQDLTPQLEAPPS